MTRFVFSGGGSGLDRLFRELEDEERSELAEVESKHPPALKALRCEVCLAGFRPLRGLPEGEEPMSAAEPVDVELAAWCRSWIEPGSYIRPADLQRERDLTWNAACSALEALEARGVLERRPGPGLAWRIAPPPQKPGKGYALPLSSKEHGALLRLLDWYADLVQRHGQFSVPSEMKADGATLRAIRSRLKRPC